MTITSENIKASFEHVSKLMANPSDYLECTEAIITLANQIVDFAGESEELWYFGEGGEFTLSDLIVGASWHFSQWHGGQHTKSYEALSALSAIFSAGHSSEPTEDDPEFWPFHILGMNAGTYYNQPFKANP